MNNELSAHDATDVFVPVRAHTAKKVYALAAAVLVLYWPSLHSLIELWFSASNDTYQYGLLVAVIAGWMMWRRRGRLDASRTEPTVLPALCLLGATPLWLISYLAGIQTGHQVLMPGIVGLAVCAFFGWQVAFIVAFPIAYFYLAVPVWGVAIDVLRWITTHVVTGMLTASGFQNHLAHPLIIIPEGAFEVGAGCAGLNFILIAVAVSTLYGELLEASRRRRAALAAIAVLAGLAANWVRIYIIVLAGHFTHMQHYLVTKSHYGFGWALFAVIMCLYLYLLKPTSEKSMERVPEAMSWRATLAQPPRLSVLARFLSRLGHSAPYVAALALLSVPAFLVAHEFRTPPPAAVSLPRDAIGSWSAEHADPAWQPQFAGADAQGTGAYVRGTERVELYRAVYAEQHQDKELINEENDVVGMKNSEIVDSGEGGQGLDQLRVRDAHGVQWLYWYGYRIGGRTVRRGLQAQLTYAFASLRGPVVSRVTVLRARCGAQCTQAARQLADFAAAHSSARPDIP